MTKKLSKILILWDYIVIYLVNKYLLSTYYVPGIVLSAGNKAFGEIDKSCCFIELDEINKWNQSIKHFVCSGVKPKEKNKSREKG